MIELALTLGSFIVFITLGFIFGRRAERRHFADIQSREAQMSGFTATQSKQYLLPQHTQPPALIVAETVVASDYLKTFLASLRNLFGGEVKSFETLLERARREVTLRLMEEAHRHGYNAICNVRLNTANLGGMGPHANAMAAIVGSATAYHTGLGSSSPRYLV